MFLRKMLLVAVLGVGLTGCYYYDGPYDSYSAPYYYPGYAPYSYYYGPRYYSGPRYYGGYRYYHRGGYGGYGGYGGRYHGGGYRGGHH